jgi:hypothetical protein
MISPIYQWYLSVLTGPNEYVSAAQPLLPINDHVWAGVIAQPL